MTEIQALKSELESLRSERTAWRVTAENAEKQLEDLKASIGEPVAIADGTFNHGCKLGTPLYAIKEVKQ